MAQAYVETSQPAAVAVEGVVVEVNELFCWTKVSRVRLCIFSTGPMAVSSRRFSWG